MTCPTLVIDGDIFATPLPREVVVVGHGVNTQGAMGAGFAKLIADRFPRVKRNYQLACVDGRVVAGRTQLLSESNNLFVANIASQNRLGRDARLVWLESALEDMYEQLGRLFPATVSVQVRLPLIGAGIGGLDPVKAAGTIFDVADKSPLNIVTSLYLLSVDGHTNTVADYYSKRYVR